MSRESLRQDMAVIADYWFPVERALKILDPEGRDMEERVRMLTPHTSQDERDVLNYLRRERNRVMHKQIPLFSPVDFKNKAIDSIRVLNRVHLRLYGRRLPIDGLDEIIATPKDEEPKDAQGFLPDDPVFRFFFWFTIGVAIFSYVRSLF